MNIHKLISRARNFSIDASFVKVTFITMKSDHIIYDCIYDIERNEKNWVDVDNSEISEHVDDQEIEQKQYEHILANGIPIEEYME